MGVATDITSHSISFRTCPRAMDEAVLCQHIKTRLQESTLEQKYRELGVCLFTFISHFLLVDNQRSQRSCRYQRRYWSCRILFLLLLTLFCCRYCCRCHRCCCSRCSCCLSSSSSCCLASWCLQVVPVVAVLVVIVVIAVVVLALFLLNTWCC